MSKQRHTINIPNWDSYQPNMRPGKHRRRRREWVAISVDLFSDPDFLALTPSDRLCWVGLLLHAGKVGVPFEFDTSLARVQFGLKHSPSFQSLVDQGFIEIATATRQDKTGQDKTVHKTGATHPKNVSKNRKKKKVVKKPANEIEGLNLDAWKTWLAYRTATNKPVYTTNGQSLKLAKLPHDKQMECVTASIDQAYTGLFPDKFTGDRNETHNGRTDNSFDARRARNAKRAGLDQT